MSGILSGCQVSSDNPADMHVAVAAGEALFGSSVVAISAASATITAADANNPRLDLVTAKSDGTIVVTAGAAAAQPVAPAPAGSNIPLALVFVPAGTTGITDHYVADRRRIVGGVGSVAGRSGAVTLTLADVGLTAQAAPAAVANLTDSSGGVAASTLVAVRSDTLAHAAADANVDIASLNAQINAVNALVASLQAKLVSSGLLT